MAIAISEPVAEVIDTNAGDAESMNVGAFTPSNDSLLIVFCFVRGTTVEPVITSTAGLSWTKRISSPTGGIGVSSCYTAPVGTGASTVITATCSGDAPTGFIIIVFQVTGYTTIVQTASTGSGTVSASTMDLTFSSALRTTSVYCIAGSLQGDNSPNATPPAGWTETVDGGYITLTTGAIAAFRAGGETGTAYSFDVDDFVDNAYTMMGMEIAAPLTMSTSGEMAFSGAITQALALHPLITGALTFAGALNEDITNSVAGVLTFAGGLGENWARTFDGVITFSGGFVKDIGKALAGAITFKGAASGTNAVKLLRKIFGKPNPSGQIKSGKRV